MVGKETAVLWASLAFLAGLIFGLASCTPDSDYQNGLHVVQMQ